MHVAVDVVPRESANHRLHRSYSVDQVKLGYDCLLRKFQELAQWQRLLVELQRGVLHHIPVVGQVTLV